MRPPDENFWHRLSGTKQTVLTLDYDGTLAPFQVDRMAAFPLPGVMEVVKALAEEGSTHVAIISGRPVDELLELLGAHADRLVLIGSHGWEWLDPGGPPLRIELTEDIQLRVRRAYFDARSFVARQPGPQRENALRLELKPAGVAAHVRGLDEDTAILWLAGLRSLWEPVLAPGLELMSFDGGLELRCRDRDKGTAAGEFWQLIPGADLVVHIGDDLTDEDVFRSLPPDGVGIKVGGQGTTRAHYRLPDVEAVKEFLVRWEKTITSPKGEQP